VAGGADNPSGPVPPEVPDELPAAAAARALALLAVACTDAFAEVGGAAAGGAIGMDGTEGGPDIRVPMGTSPIEN
jgi:hypothetical protein